MSNSKYLSAKEASDILGVNLATLYAYVSRGMIRSEAEGDSKRTRRYNAEDVRRLKERKDQRRNPEKIAETALHFGAPLLDSAITLIVDGKLYYRGLDATLLAQNYSVEQVAALIWLGALDGEISGFSDKEAGILPARCQAVLPYLQDLTTFERFQALLPLIAVDDLAAYGRNISEIARTGARLLRYMTAIATNRDSAAGIVETLMPENLAAAKLVNAALILCADHELNVSAFTARCVASAESTPYDAVIAGLSALKGAKHGGNTERVERLFQDVRAVGNLRIVLASYRKEGAAIPGFGHHLYPEGDPRGRTLLELVKGTYPDAEAVRLAESIEKAVFEMNGQYINIDFALVTLVNTLGLPRGAAMTLFALGRTIGWIGHIIEQYETGELIRPRARYTGQPPLTDS